MNSPYLGQVIRFIVIVFIQVTIFQSAFINWQLGPYLYVFFYPIFILLLPIRTPPIAVIGIAFVMGLIIDFFSSSLGVHTSALLFVAFIRPYILNFIEPRKRYEVLAVPSYRSYGMTWFIKYAAVLIFAHVFIYYAMDAFTLKFIVQILLKTMVSGTASLVCIIIYQLIFSSTE